MSPSTIVCSGWYVFATICQKQRRATLDRYLGLKLVDEVLKIAIRLARRDGDETVQDEQCCIMPPNLVPQ
jgi:hypothetical protein